MHRLTEVTLTGSHDDIEAFVQAFETANRDLNLMLFRELFDPAFNPRDQWDRDHVNTIMGVPTQITTAPELVAKRIDDASSALDLTLSGPQCVTKDILCLAGVFSLSVKASLIDVAGSHRATFAAHFFREH